MLKNRSQYCCICNKGVKAVTTNYPSNLTFQQFKIIEPLIPPAKHGGRPRTVNIQAIINGTLMA